MKSENEEYCKEQFAIYLKTVETQEIRWQEVSQKEEPPDFYLFCGVDKYAVEVTILTEKMPFGSSSLPINAIYASLKKLVDEVESTSHKMGMLHGGYAITFSKPIANFRAIKDKLRDALLSYIQSTQTLDSAPAAILYADRRVRVKIEKFNSPVNYVGMMGPSSGKWEGEVAKEIFGLIEERVGTKIQKLSRVTEPKILILYDAYHFATEEMFQQSINHLPAKANFHTIFVAQIDEAGFIVHTNNDIWNK